MDVDALAAAFSRVPGYLNTASLGLPARAGSAAIRQHLDDWEHGRTDPPEFDEVIARCRRAYARFVGTDESAVAVLNQASPAAGVVASSLPDGAHVLCAEEDFTSVLFPFLVDDRLRVRIVPLEHLLDSITPDVDLVAVSAVQSADGRRLDLDALADAAAAAGARTFLDVTQSAGWVPIDTSRFDVTACAAYKWLCCPRGVAFMTVTPSAIDWLVPRNAGWFAGADVWRSIYGPPLRLAEDARRLDISPAWIAWVGAMPTLELFAEVDVAAIERHDVGLANELLARLELEPSNTAIVSLDLGDAAERLQAAGIRCAPRAGRIRFSFHHYNTIEDVDLLLAALGR